MPSVFDRLLLQNPAEILFVALAATVAGVIILVVFILTRRALRSPLLQLQHPRHPCCASAGRKTVDVSYRREAL